MSATRTGSGAAAAAAISLMGGMVAAQDANPQAQVEAVTETLFPPQDSFV